MALTGLMKSWHMRAARKAASWAVLVRLAPAGASETGDGAASLMARESGVIWRRGELPSPAGSCGERER